MHCQTGPSSLAVFDEEIDLLLEELTVIEEELETFNELDDDIDLDTEADNRAVFVGEGERDDEISVEIDRVLL